ncbi:MAG: hypothetical protein QOH66_2548 [Actinomycetota bacterium]|nr:hypothetical protein [Actinomycetota bacterium]
MRYNLSVDEVFAVLEGRTVATVYQCQICQRLGDARVEPANAVLWVAADGDDGPPGAMLALVHAACGPSEVRLIEEWAAMPHPDAAFQEHKPLTVVSLLMDSHGDPWASLTLQPGAATRCLADGEVLQFEHALGALMAEGWGDAVEDVPVVEGWAVHVDAGRLSSVTRGGDEYWRAPGSTLLPDHWQRAANGRGEVLVLVVPPASLHGQGEYYDVLAKLEARGQLAAARLALRGTLNIR